MTQPDGRGNGQASTQTNNSSKQAEYDKVVILSTFSFWQITSSLKYRVERPQGPVNVCSRESITQLEMNQDIIPCIV